MSKKISLADWQQQHAASASEPTATTALSGQATADNLVYSTATGRIKPNNAVTHVGERFADGALRIRRETKGRGGKTVLTIAGLQGSLDELTALCTELKKQCACGGAVKEGIIEIQADKRELVADLLQKKGYQVKQAGG